MNNDVKDLKYYRANAEEDYITTPISVLRYIGELEKVLSGQEHAEKPEPKKSPTTYRECLEALPDGYRELALKNAEVQNWGGEKPDSDCKNVYEAVALCIVWDKTPQKYRFWDIVYDHYYRNTPLPELPNNE